MKKKTKNKADTLQYSKNFSKIFFLFKFKSIDELKTELITIRDTNIKKPIGIGS
ncbi:MAG: hypothetical protein ACFFAO_14025 [Candidatus Hermodarchaeota archaeon]